LGRAEVAVKPDIPDEWRAALCSWAGARDSVRELWLFGSHAKECSRPDSDVDLALGLVPRDWAFGKFVASSAEWQQQLETIVGRHVSLTLISHAPEEVRNSAILLWSRDG
jgi:predicted nucleotidyltransferase